MARLRDAWSLGWLFVALAGCGSAGSTMDDGAGDTSPAGSDATGGTPGCECVDDFPLEGYECDYGIDCGAWLEHVEGDTGGACQDPSETSGGDPDCEEELADNGLVARCVLESAASGATFHFAHAENPGNAYSRRDDYWVTPGAPLRVLRRESADSCELFWTELRAAPDFGMCAPLIGSAAWTCIHEMVSGPPTAACADWGGCEGI